MRIAMEMVGGLRCKLRMVGASVDGLADVFCDNESLVQGASRLESPLKKKRQDVFHQTREACTGDSNKNCKERHHEQQW